MLLWLVLGVCLASLIYLSKETKEKKMYPIIGTLAIVRSILTLGVQPTLTILGLIQVSGYEGREREGGGGERVGGVRER